MREYWEWLMSLIENAARSLAIPPVPMTVRRLRLSSSESGLVWSRIVESWDERKNSLIAEIIGLALIREAGDGISSSTEARLIRSLITRSIRSTPILKAFWATSSPTRRSLLLPR